MANPAAPQEGSANTRRLPYLVDPDNPGTAYLPVGSGALSMGSGRTPGAVPGALGWSLGSDGVPLQHHAPDTFVPFALSTVTTEQLVWTPASGKAARLLKVIIVASVDTVVEVIDGTGGPTLLRLPCPASIPFPFDLGPIGRLSAAPDNGLYVTSTDAADLDGTLMGCEE